jgi:iron complex transport system ATP-binding protein
MLKVNNLCLQLSQIEILKNINFQINKGELVSLLGPNGSGKSSIIKSISGIHSCYKGNIFYNDSELNGLKHSDRAKVISYVPQLLNADYEYTVWEFLSLSRFAYMNGYRGLLKEEKNLAQSLLVQFKIEDLKNRKMNELSGGEAQKVHIAAAVFQEPDILLLDEPTSFLDPAHQDEINNILIELKKDLAILCVSHDMNSSLVNSDRILCLKKGELIFDGTPETVLHNRVLDKLFDKEFTLIKHPKANIEIIVPELFNNE